MKKVIWAVMALLIYKNKDNVIYWSVICFYINALKTNY